MAPHLAAYDSASSESQQRDFHTHLHQTLNAPSHPIRNRLLRITSDSPDLLAIIIRMQGQFDQLAQTHPEEHHLEF